MRTRAEIIRNMRHAAQIHRDRKKVYSRMKEWKESGVGTDQEKHVVTLHAGWSFSNTEIVQTKNFSSVGDAMRGISKTYHCPADDNACGVDSGNWQDKLKALTGVTA